MDLVSMTAARYLYYYLIRRHGRVLSLTLVHETQTADHEESLSMPHTALRLKEARIPAFVKDVVYRIEQAERV